jgi:hypothetical protein
LWYEARDMAEPLLDAESHRRLAAALFNRTWDLLELPGRTREQDDEVLHTAHASRYHWGETGRWPNIAVGEWQCSRVYAVLGRPEPALWHARRCLELCEEHGVGDYRLAAAYEALARAELAAGDLEAARRWKAKGLAACAKIAKAEDRAPILADLDGLAL